MLEKKEAAAMPVMVLATLNRVDYGQEGSHADTGGLAAAAAAAGAAARGETVHLQTEEGPPHEHD